MDPPSKVAAAKESIVRAKEGTVSAAESMKNTFCGNEDDQMYDPDA